MWGSFDFAAWDCEDVLLYGPNRIKQLNIAYSESLNAYTESLRKITLLCNLMKNQKAKEFILHGAGRRLSLIHQCIRNIFRIYPPSRITPLTLIELHEISLNLHAFFINLSGIYDNLAWALVLERDLSQQNNKFNVTLYKRPKKVKVSTTDVSQPAEPPLVAKEPEDDDSDGEIYIANEAILTKEFAEYLNGENINKWLNKYLRQYRDALAHQIPVYVPPGITEKGEEVLCPYFRGSMYNKTAVEMHVQLLADFNTVVELIEKYAELEFPKYKS